MSDGVLAALIGLAGTVVGAVAAVLVARIQTGRPKNGDPPGGPGTTVVLGGVVDIRELRILRALFGEPKGRFLEAYSISYYGPSLEAVIKKGWVKRIKEKTKERFCLTQQGADFCRAYLKQLLGAWHPPGQALA
jgi:hypothetical protein